MTLAWISYTESLLLNIWMRITPSYSQFLSLSVNIIKTQKGIWAMFSGRYFDSNHSGKNTNPYEVDAVARYSSSALPSYPVPDSVFPLPVSQISGVHISNYGRDMRPYAAVPDQSILRTPTREELLANHLNNHVNYFQAQSSSPYIPLESSILQVSPTPQTLQYNGYNISSLNTALTRTPSSVYEAGSQYTEMSDNTLKEKIRASILQQINPHLQRSPMFHENTAMVPNNPAYLCNSNQMLGSNSMLLTEARKRQKRPSNTKEEIGGKKQRFVDNHFRKNTPSSSGGPGLHSFSPKAGTNQSNRKGGYHDGASHLLPEQLIRRAISPKDPCQKLSRAVINYFLENQQTNEVFERKMKLRDALFSVVQSVFPHSGLYIVGSSMSGFGTKKSDMDMCLMISQQGIDQKREATDLLYALQRALRKCSFVKNLEVIRAKVPILRFRDKVSNVECDLNVNNLVGIRNTHLLKHYALSDWRVRPLGLFIKYWARSQNINDARNMTISSYSFALMMIHYLQCGCTPPVLPSLQVKYAHEFNPKTDVRQLKPVTFSHQSPNTLSIGELFLGFLEYFSFTFDYRNDAICVRLGKTLAVRDVQKQTNDYGRQWSCLCIEEPFDLTNTARSVYNQQIFQQIQKAF